MVEEDVDRPGSGAKLESGLGLEAAGALEFVAGVAKEAERSANSSIGSRARIRLTPPPDASADASADACAGMEVK